MSEATEADATECPECEVGKHGNCDTTSWSNTLDQPCPCRCWLNGHQ